MCSIDTSASCCSPRKCCDCAIMRSPTSVSARSGEVSAAWRNFRASSSASVNCPLLMLPAHRPHKRPQPVIGAAEPLGELQRSVPRDARLTRRPGCIHERPAVRRVQLHDALFAHLPGRRQPFQRLLDPRAAFIDQRQMEPQRDCGHREPDGVGRFAFHGERPVERRPQVIQVHLVGRQPLRRRQGFPVERRLIEQRREAARHAGAP